MSCPALLMLSYRYLDVIEQALAAGEVVLIENIKERVDPLLEPLLGRQTLKKGRQVCDLYLFYTTDSLIEWNAVKITLKNTFFYCRGF